MIEPIHQDPADLVLTVLAGKPQTPLTILKQAALDLKGWTFTFHIIGESHLVTIAHEGQLVMCELLACVDAAAAAYVHRHSFKHLTEHCYEQSGYTIDVNFDRHSETSAFNDSQNMLEVVFPDIDGQMPVTRIIWSQAGENIVRWQTLHLYPRGEKMTAVRSFSHFDTLHYNRPS